MKKKSAWLILLAGLALGVAGLLYMRSDNTTEIIRDPTQIKASDAESLNPVRRIPGQYKKHLERREALTDARVEEARGNARPEAEGAWKPAGKGAWSGPGARAHDPSPEGQRVEPTHTAPLKVHVIKR